MAADMKTNSMRMSRGVVNRTDSQSATYVRLICRQSNVYPNLLIAIFIITNANVNITHPKAENKRKSCSRRSKVKAPTKETKIIFTQPVNERFTELTRIVTRHARIEEYFRMGYYDKPILLRFPRIATEYKARVADEYNAKAAKSKGSGAAKVDNG